VTSKSRRDELKGKQFGKGIVLSFSHLNQSRSAQWNCRCACGGEYIVSALNLKKGSSTQCWLCARKEKTPIYHPGNQKKFIYIFQLQNYFKVGVTDNPRKRLDTINRATPFKAVEVFLGLNKPGLEKEICTKYKEKRSTGEWFLFSLEDIEEIKELACSGSETCLI